MDMKKLKKRINLKLEGKYVGILKRLPKQDEESRVCDSIIFEIPTLTVASIIS